MPLRPDFGPCQMIGNLEPTTGTASYDMGGSILIRKPNPAFISKFFTIIFDPRNSFPGRAPAQMRPDGPAENLA